MLISSRYYIFTDYYPTAKPLAFVPVHQLQALIDEINATFPEANAILDDRSREEGVVIDFDTCLDGELSDLLRPRFLGHATCREQINYWADNLPSPPSVTVTREMEADRSFQAYKELIENAIAAGKNKSKAKRKAQQGVASERKLQSKRQVLNAQRYLGLLPEQDDKLGSSMGQLSLSRLDDTKPPPFTSVKGPIFIAIDCEAWEEGGKPVTEVGVATLDTRDLQGVPPGPCGENWQKLIRARHFRIVERKHMVNKKYVNGCPENFEFGETEFVSKDHIASAVASCFRDPFSKPLDQSNWPKPGEEATEKPRNIILLGHDLSQDIQYCKSIGFSVLNRGNLLEAMDTAVMYRAYTQDVNPTSLGRVLYAFEMSGWHRKFTPILILT
jgi:hypothetical protein